MPSKSVILILAVFVAFLAGLAFYWFIFETGKVSAPSFTVEEQKITKEENPLKFDIAYPRVLGADEFNKKIEGLIEKEMADFKKNSLENDAIIKKADPESWSKFPRTYDMTSTYQKGEISAETLSAVLEIYKFEGGAHGNTNFYAINYSPKNKKEIKLADLFAGQQDYLQKISSYCVGDLKKQIAERAGVEGVDESWLQEGAGPAEENFSTFLINPSTGSGQATLTFYFPQYQVAPYSAGIFTVTMPR